MNREWITQYSSYLSRDMHMLVYGWGGTPLVAFPCQDGMCDNWEGFQMPDTLGDYIENGQIQLFVVDTVDKESWSDEHGDKEHRAWIQECYYNYIVEECIPFVREINGTGILPVVTGFSLGATHAAIVFLRRPDLFKGVIALSGSYDACDMFEGWLNETLYNNSPVHFMQNMPADHYYIDLYNQKKIILCVGQGAWEEEGIRTTGIMDRIFKEKGISAWCDFWGYDVNHDWPWWRKQIRHFLPYVID